MTREAEWRTGPDGRAVLLVAGLADLAVTTAGSALGAVRGCSGAPTPRNWRRRPSAT